MIWLLSEVKIIDNTGGLWGKCIKILSSKSSSPKKSFGKVGDLILITVTKTLPGSKMQKGDIVKALIVRTKKFSGKSLSVHFHKRDFSYLSRSWVEPNISWPIKTEISLGGENLNFSKHNLEEAKYRFTSNSIMRFREYIEGSSKYSSNQQKDALRVRGRLITNDEVSFKKRYRIQYWPTLLISPPLEENSTKQPINLVESCLVEIRPEYHKNISELNTSYLLSMNYTRIVHSLLKMTWSVPHNLVKNVCFTQIVSLRNLQPFEEKVGKTAEFLISPKARSVPAAKCLFIEDLYRANTNQIIRKTFKPFLETLNINRGNAGNLQEEYLLKFGEQMKKLFSSQLANSQDRRRETSLLDDQDSSEKRFAALMAEDGSMSPMWERVRANYASLSFVELIRRASRTDLQYSKQKYFSVSRDFNPFFDTKCSFKNRFASNYISDTLEGGTLGAYRGIGQLHGNTERGVELCSYVINVYKRGLHYSSRIRSSDCLGIREFADNAVVLVKTNVKDLYDYVPLGTRIKGPICHSLKKTQSRIFSITKVVGAR